MSNIKTVVLKVHTGFCGAVHEEDVEYEGQTHSELEALLNDFREQVQSELETEYVFLDADGEEIDE